MSNIILNKLQLKSIDIIKSKQNIFLTGAPGTGKSFTLLYIISYIKTTNLNYAISALTGCAAVLINGQTLHSLFCIGIDITLPIANIIKNLRIFKKFDILRYLDILIVDEISMMNTDLLEKCSEILCTIKKSDKPFGGIQLIFIGDFYQLAPVDGDYCFLSPLWKQLNLCKIELIEYIRQKDDEEFIDILSKLRIGKITTKIFNRLKELHNTEFSNDILPTKLYPLNKNVDYINNTEFNKLYEFKKKNNINNEKIIYQYNITTINNKIYKIEPDIKLIVGLQIIITRNIDIYSKLINGTRGIIIRLFPDYVVIKDIQGNIHNIKYHVDINDTNKNNKITITFMPIKLAYALSIHKSQGATLDSIEIDGSDNIFAAGQLYTALSRGRSLSSIRLLNLSTKSFITNKKVKEFYNNQ